MQTALSKGLSLMHNTHISRFITTITPTPGRSDTPFWPLRALHSHAQTHTQKKVDIRNKSLKQIQLKIIGVIEGKYAK